MSLNKRVVLVGTGLFILACLFPYKEPALYGEGESGYHFITTEKVEYTGYRCEGYGCAREIPETRTGTVVIKKDVLAIELIAILFGTLGLAFVLGKDKRGK